MRCEAVIRTEEENGVFEYVFCKQDATVFRAAVDTETDTAIDGKHMCDECLNQHKKKATYAPWLSIVVFPHTVLKKSIFGKDS